MGSGRSRAGSRWAVLFAAVAMLVASACRPGVFTHANNSARTGAYADQSALTPSLVGGGTFGQMFETAVDGQVYAQPVITDDTVVVVTEKNNIYGIDRLTGQRTWSRNVGVPFNATDVACPDLVPYIGVTGTPVVDATSNTAYFFSKTYASGTSGAARWYAHAVDVPTGVERNGFPVRIEGTASDDPNKAFNPTTSLQRTGLLLLDGVIYAGFGGHCDHQPYSGWVVGVTTAGAITTFWSPSPGNRGAAGIWQSGGGLVSDGPGSLFLATGNGSPNVTARPGANPGAALGHSVVHLRVQPNKSLRAVDFFSPYDADLLETWDGDLGSGGPVLLPPAPFGTTAHPRLLAIAGKQGYVYLLDAADLGGMKQGPNGGDRVVARIGSLGGVWGQTGVWSGDGGYIYVLPPGSTFGDGVVRVLKWGLDAYGNPALAEIARAAESAGFGSTAAVVSSDGTTSGSGLLWVVARDASGSGGQLRAYDAVPVNGKLVLRWSGSVGLATKFSLPTIFGDRVYVGTADGRLLSFGSPVARPLTGGPLTIPKTNVGDTRTANLTLRATTDLHVTRIDTTNSDFSVGTPSAADPPQQGLPIDLPVGHTMTVPVTFAPTTPGPASGEVNITTNARDVSIGISSFGINPTGLLKATPSLLSFGGAAAGGPPVSMSVSIENVGATDVTVNAVTSPGAPFSVSGLPAPGAAVKALSTVVATATFAPTVVGNWQDLLTLHTSAGDVEIPISGTAAPPPVMSLSSTNVSFGSMPIGGTAVRSFTVTNTGGSALSITKSKPPAAGRGFLAITALPEATVIGPGESRTVTVTFNPSVAGARNDTWILNGNDGGGERTVTFTGTGVTGTTVPGPSDAWTLNGTATFVGSALELTGLTTDARGSSFAPNPIGASSIVVSFDGAIGYGSGADGMALVFGDVARGASGTSLGTSGGGLGFAGIPGTAVAIDTYQGAGDPSANFVGLTDGPGAAPNQLHWLATASLIPSLREARHYVISIANGMLVVTIGGAVVLTASGVALPSSFRLGFSGASGRLTDIHRVSGVTIRYG